MAAAPASKGSARTWLLRCIVWTGLALTLWLAGPRAYAVLRSRVSDASRQGSALVELGRGQFLRLPEWARGDSPAHRALRRALITDLTGRLDERGRIPSIGILDDDGAAALQQRLLASPWVTAVRLEREFPQSLRLELDLREPVLVVVRPDPDGQPVAEALVDAAGLCLPPIDGYPAAAEVPATQLVGPPPSGRSGPVQFGAVHPDRRVVAAAATAAEWQRQLRPAMPEAPPLVEVDASNLDYRYLAARRWAEVRVGLRAGDGATVWFDYDRPPFSPLPRVPLADKVAVLRAILAEHPELRGLARGSLILRNTWASELVPRSD